MASKLSRDTRFLMLTAFAGVMALAATSCSKATTAPAASQPASQPAVSRPHAAASSAADNWPCFRGPNFGRLSARAGDPPVEIDLARDVRFATPLDHGGISSPIIWGDRIYLTGERGHVMAFDRATGEAKWDTTLSVAAGAEESGEEEAPPDMSAGRAAPTPVTDGQRVYAFFGNGVLGCVDSAGKQIWARRLFDGPSKNSYGLASSPLLCGELLIQEVDRGMDPDEKLSFIVAVRSRDGVEVWRKTRAVMSAWSSPILVRGPSGDALVTAAPPLVIAYNPQTGQELWRAEGPYGSEYSVSPVPCGDGSVAMTADGFSAFKLGGKGDITKTGKAWSSDASSPTVASPVSDATQTFHVTATGEVVCLDAATGKEKWTLALEGEFWASPVLTKDRLYAVTREGVLFVVSLDGKKLHEVKLDKNVMASPAVLDGRLYIRAGNELMCIGKP